MKNVKEEISINLACPQSFMHFMFFMVSFVAFRCVPTRRTETLNSYIL